MGDVIEIGSGSGSDSDVEIVGVTVMARVVKSETCGMCRPRHTCSEWSRSRVRGPLRAVGENIDLTGDENEVHNQVKAIKEDTISMRDNSPNCYQAKQSQQIPASSNWNHIMLDSDDDLTDGKEEHLSLGLRSDWVVGMEEPDLKTPPLLSIEPLTEENLFSVSSNFSNDEPLPELDFIGPDESKDPCITATNGDFCRRSSEMSSSSVCSVDSTMDTSINSDVESLETFSPDGHIPCSSPSSAGGLLEDYLKSGFDETDHTFDEPEAGFSMYIEDLPPLIPQNSEDFEMSTYHYPPNINAPEVKPWKQLPRQKANESELHSLPMESKAWDNALDLDGPEDQILSSDKSESCSLTSNEAMEVKPNSSIDKELLQSFRYFMGVPIQHLFVKRRRKENWHKMNQNSQSSAAYRNISKEPELISQRQCSMINSTIDENFSQGTLQFLMDFVSPQHYPPQKAVEYIIKKILLSNEPPSTIMSTYMTLMKIQQLHPANIYTVQWDWELLAYHVENKDPHRNDSLTKGSRLLFLQYVVQTLEDDFQLKHDVPQQSIAKAVLSCDEKFWNVRSVIKWLIDICKDSEEIQERTGPTSSASNNLLAMDSRNLRVICLFQKMLTLAVEVDKSPTCSSNKIAEAIFQDFIDISKRSQRLTLLRSMESQLLRCKLLEFFFHHCTEKKDPGLPMSLGKVLHFLKYAKFNLEANEHRSSKWQYWDELVHLLCLLLLSYQEVTKRHLRLSITERVKYVLADTPPVLTTHDAITKEDVLNDMEEFYSRVFSDLGRSLNPQLEEQINLLKELLLSAATGT
ncbi:SUMO-interacting motif-containing protein 1 isoform X2 [Amblyraja radiata]|uniref:SUMO-interacting motif-containing protein 1 isoform X2 n=1 Tax=Amblyraja radiata TaxID=386614 RepID=UPI001404229B|nr:SUMO-interacting motif-containing protein 1 isoform X2 [Amblyraja radiata]